MPPTATGSRAAPNAARVQSLKPSGFSSGRIGGASTGSLRPGSSVAFAKPGSSLTDPASGGGSGGGDSNGVSGSSSAVSERVMGRLGIGVEDDRRVFGRGLRLPDKGIR